MEGFLSFDAIFLSSSNDLALSSKDLWLTSNYKQMRSQIIKEIIVWVLSLLQVIQ